MNLNKSFIQIIDNFANNGKKKQKNTPSISTTKSPIPKTPKTPKFTLDTSSLTDDDDSSSLTNANAASSSMSKTTESILNTSNKSQVSVDETENGSNKTTMNSHLPLINVESPNQNPSFNGITYNLKIFKFKREEDN